MKQQGVIKELHPHRFGYIGFYFGGLVLIGLGAGFMIELIGVGILVIALGEIFRRAETYYVLDNGVSHGYKLVGSYRKFASYEKIQNLAVTQSLLEQLLGIGTLHIDTAGGPEAEVVFSYISNPYKIERTVRDLMESKQKDT